MPGASFCVVCGAPQDPAMLQQFLTAGHCILCSTQLFTPTQQICHNCGVPQQSQTSMEHSGQSMIHSPQRHPPRPPLNIPQSPLRPSPTLPHHPSNMTRPPYPLPHQQQVYAIVPQSPPRPPPSYPGQQHVPSEQQSSKRSPESDDNFANKRSRTEQASQNDENSQTFVEMSGALVRRRLPQLTSPPAAASAQGSPEQPYRQVSDTQSSHPATQGTVQVGTASPGTQGTIQPSSPAQVGTQPDKPTLPIQTNKASTQLQESTGSRSDPPPLKQDSGNTSLQPWLKSKSEVDLRKRIRILPQAPQSGDSDNDSQYHKKRRSEESGTHSETDIPGDSEQEMLHSKALTINKTNTVQQSAPFTSEKLPSLSSDVSSPDPSADSNSNNEDYGTPHGSQVDVEEEDDTSSQSSSSYQSSAEPSSEIPSSERKENVTASATNETDNQNCGNSDKAKSSPDTKLHKDRPSTEAANEQDAPDKPQPQEKVSSQKQQDSLNNLDVTKPEQHSSSDTPQSGSATAAMEGTSASGTVTNKLGEHKSDKITSSDHPLAEHTGSTSGGGSDKETDPGSGATPKPATSKKKKKVCLFVCNDKFVCICKCLPV